MAEPSAIFPAAEYRQRVDRLQEAMEGAGQDALLLTTPPDIFYVTGFLTRFWESPTRPWFVLVPAAGTPVAVIPVIGADLMRRGWLQDIRTWVSPDPADEGVSLLAETLADLVHEAGCVAVPMGAETQLRMPLADFERVAKRIAPRRIVDGTATVRRVREIKSEAEIAKIRTVCGIADRAFARVGNFAGPGRCLGEVARSFQIALLEEGADWVSYLAAAAGTGGYADIISPAGSRVLARGDILMLDTGAVKDGYFCDFDRNYAIGPVDPAARDGNAALVAATDSALAALRPGITASDLHAVMVRALHAHGASPCAGRHGHGLGLSLTEWPSISGTDDTPLRAGMVLTLEPGVEVAPGRILVQEENIVLRPDGPELLSRRTARELPDIA